MYRQKVFTCGWLMRSATSHKLLCFRFLNQRLPSVAVVAGFDSRCFANPSNVLACGGKSRETSNGLANERGRSWSAFPLIRIFYPEFYCGFGWITASSSTDPSEFFTLFESGPFDALFKLNLIVFIRV